jgi:Type II secretion system (T2SS), protein M subtype b
MKLDLREKDRRAIFILALATGLYVLVSYVLLPAFDKLTLTPSRVSETEEQLKKYRRALIRKGHYTEQLQQAHKNLAEAEARFIRGDNPTLASVELQSIVEEAAKKVSLELSQRNVSPARKKDDFFNEITMTLAVEATPSQVFGFLAEIRNAPKYITVRNAQFSPVQVLTEPPKKGDFLKVIRANITIAAAIPVPVRKNG